VDGLSLSVQRGELFGLLGPNGAGKSTTVSLAVGLLAPDAGQISIEGLGNPREPAVRRRIGVATQALALYELLSGEENLHFFGEVYGLSGSPLASRVAWCLDFVGLTDRKADRVGTYSGGMKRRLNLAAALVHEPELLLLDEPTQGLSPEDTAATVAVIRQIARERRLTIMLVEHDMDVVFDLADRISVLHFGRLIAEGTPAEIRANAEVQTAYLGGLD
jgi:ABC-2 type transport system ATP-binding protein